jgi:hypothetical protein
MNVLFPPQKELKNLHSRNQVLAFTANHLQSVPLPHYCGISDQSVTSAAQTTGWIVKKFWMNNCHSSVWHALCSIPLFCWRITPCDSHLSMPKQQYIINSTIMMKWKRMFMSGCDCKSPISATTEFFISCQNRTNVCMYSGTVLENK